MRKFLVLLLTEAQMQQIVRGIVPEAIVEMAGSLLVEAAGDWPIRTDWKQA